MPPYQIAINDLHYMTAVSSLANGVNNFAPAVEVPEHTSVAVAMQKYQSTLTALAQMMSTYQQLLQRDTKYLREVQRELQQLDASLAGSMGPTIMGPTPLLP